MHTILRIFGKAQVESEVTGDPDGGSTRVANNEVRITKLGIPLYLLHERYDLDADGTDVSVVSDGRFGPIPFLFNLRKLCSARIKAGGRGAVYQVPLLGDDWVADDSVQPGDDHIDARLRCPWNSARGGDRPRHRRRGLVERRTERTTRPEARVGQPDPSGRSGRRSRRSRGSSRRETVGVGARRTHRVAAATLSLLFLVGACGDAGDDAGWWRPDATATWQWQLQGTVNTGYDVDVYDVDLFETAPEVLDALRADGRMVVCYFAAGTWETFRDGPAPPAEAIGLPLDGFPDERWLDVRHDAVRALVEDRLDLARERSCGGVEPDNVDGFANDTGFDLTTSDQLDFNRFVAAEAHDRNLAVGLKNELDQVAELVGDFDFAVNEQCHEYDECETLTPFVAAGKPVFNAEYDHSFRLDPASMCEDSRRLGLQTLVLPLELDDSFRLGCADRPREDRRSRK
jgi:hypothetical protein